MKGFLKILPRDTMDIAIVAWAVVIVLALVGSYIYLRFVKNMKPKANLFQLFMDIEGSPKEGGNDAGKN